MDYLQLIFHFILHGLVGHLMHGLVVCEPVWTGSPVDIPLNSAFTSSPSNVWTSGM